MPHRARRFPPTPRALAPLLLAPLLLVLAACQNGPSKDEVEAAKKTIDCQRGDERILIRFDDDEARLAMPDGSRVVLYPVAVGSGIRYTNGIVELRGKGLDLQYIRDGEAVALKCKPFELPKKE